MPNAMDGAQRSALSCIQGSTAASSGTLSRAQATDKENGTGKHSINLRQACACTVHASSLFLGNSASYLPRKQWHHMPVWTCM